MEALIIIIFNSSYAASVSVIPVFGMAFISVLFYDCCVLGKHRNMWAKHFTCVSLSWICRVLKFIPLVDFGKETTED